MNTSKEATPQDCNTGSDIQAQQTEDAKAAGPADQSSDSVNQGTTDNTKPFQELQHARCLCWVTKTRKEGAQERRAFKNLFLSNLKPRCAEPVLFKLHPEVKYSWSYDDKTQLHTVTLEIDDENGNKQFTVTGKGKKLLKEQVADDALKYVFKQELDKSSATTWQFFKKLYLVQNDNTNNHAKNNSKKRKRKKTKETEIDGEKCDTKVNESAQTMVEDKDGAKNDTEDKESVEMEIKHTVNIEMGVEENLESVNESDDTKKQVEANESEDKVVEEKGGKRERIEDNVPWDDLYSYALYRLFNTWFSESTEQQTKSQVELPKKPRSNSRNRQRKRNQPLGFRRGSSYSNNSSYGMGRRQPYEGDSFYNQNSDYDFSPFPKRPRPDSLDERSLSLGYGRGSSLSNNSSYGMGCREPGQDYYSPYDQRQNPEFSSFKKPVTGSFGRGVSFWNFSENKHLKPPRRFHNGFQLKLKKQKEMAPSSEKDFADPVSLLNTLDCNPVYRTVLEGNSESPLYVTSLSVNNDQCSMKIGRGKTEKEAKSSAAQRALEAMGIPQYNLPPDDY